MPTIERLSNAVKSGFILLLIFILIHIVFMIISLDLSMSHFGIFSCVFIAGALSYLAIHNTAY